MHGGGFYHVQKYLTAPAKLPEHLTWFKWESYATWLSGFAMLAIVYYLGADLYLVDRSVLDVSAPVAILISIASLTVGWIIYDLLCKSPIGKNTNLLMVILYFMLVAMAYGYTQLFTGRAAFVHLGAFTATIMSANVFLLIIPNQKKVVATLLAGGTPDPSLGAAAKQRSLHNNYLTLPVIFLMLSNHNPLAFGTQYSWMIASLVFLMGVTIRHYFNSKHARKGKPTWTWVATVILFIAIMWLSTNPKLPGIEAEAATLSVVEQKFASAAGFEAARDAVMGRCSMCHAAEPVWEGIVAAPKGVMLDSDQKIAAHAREIYLQAGRSHAMPPANITEISPEERRAIADWYQAAISGS